jgi:hypothetical protein
VRNANKSGQRQGDRTISELSVLADPESLGRLGLGYLTLLPGPELLESLCVANRAAIALDWDWLGKLQKIIAITLGEVLVYDDLQPAVATYTVVPGIALQILLGHSPIRGACHEAPSQ